RSGAVYRKHRAARSVYRLLTCSLTDLMRLVHLMIGRRPLSLWPAQSPPAFQVAAAPQPSRHSQGPRLRRPRPYAPRQPSSSRHHPSLRRPSCSPPSCRRLFRPRLSCRPLSQPPSSRRPFSPPPLSCSPSLLA